MEERNEVVVQAGNSLPTSDINQGTVAIESSRAVAEAQGKLLIAKKFPRNETEAFSKAIQSCQRTGLASKAFYSYPRGKETITGVTIRFAEELARCYGNLDYGIKELSNSNGQSEMQAYCWDLETNTMSLQNFTNKHIRESKYGNTELKSQRDIYELNANMGARRLRSRILAILPPDLVEACIQECKKTLAGDNTIPFIDKVNNMVVAFQKLGVSKEQLEKRLNHTVESITEQELLEMIGIFNGIKNKETKVSEWFEQPRTASALTEAINAEIKEDAKNE
jgi:hypothetical protein|uniref:Uncharacterized protein n=1 Tax=Myoviridae sp. ctW7Z6 TaxID=2826661 RepID=A0A8S5NNA3_9CAUD|nr:MAG TPA: hypothetical protein [Myoviridae sp. ctW7Z6]